jgi:hypothetical protein
VIELDLGSNVSTTHSMNWRTKTNIWTGPAQRETSGLVERLNVLSSTSFSDKPGEASVELKCDTEWGTSDDYFFRWTHIQRNDLDFNEFMRIALQGSRLSEDMALVVDHLLSAVRKDMERSYVHGKYVVPGSMRCDGIDATKFGKEVSATFISTYTRYICKGWVDLIGSTPM